MDGVVRPAGFNPAADNGQRMSSGRIQVQIEAPRFDDLGREESRGNVLRGTHLAPMCFWFQKKSKILMHWPRIVIPELLLTDYA